MKIYVIKYEKNNEEYKKIVLKMQNDLTGEEVFYSGFLKELSEERKWGEKGWLSGYAEIYKDKPTKK